MTSVNTTQNNRLSSIESITGSYATTGSNTFRGNQTISGSTYVTGDLIVQGSSSIQYISASSVSIGTNIVQLNTANPSVRFAGLTIIDSGSVGGSGSFLYDSVHDEFIFVHRGNGTNITSSHFVLGPETYDSLGNELYLTCNRISKGTGKEHLVDSCIFDNGTTTCFYNSTTINSSGILTSTNLVGTICARNGIVSGSAQIDVSSTTGDIALGTRTSGNYVACLVAGTNITLSNNTGEGATPTIGLTNNTISGISLGSNLATLTIGTGLSGTSYNGSTAVTIANTITNNNQLTNGAGYITSAGTAAAVNQTIAAGSEGNIVFATIGTNDFFRIRGGGASNAGFVEIATADDGTEPIYLRQYTGEFASITRTATLLDGSGNTSFPGTIGASNYSGTHSGTSSGTNTGDQTNISGNAATVTNGVYTNASNTLTNNLNITGGQGAGNTTAYSSAKRLIFDNDYTTTAKGPNKITLYDASFLAGFGIHDNTVSYYSGGTHKWYKATTADNASIMMQVDASGNFNATGDVTAYSDIRIKENILNIIDPLNKVLRLRGVSYNRIDTDDKSTKIGFIAQEVEKIVPEVVTYDKEQDRYGVSYGNITALLVEAIKEQQIKIDNLTIEVENLKKPKGL